MLLILSVIELVCWGCVPPLKKSDRCTSGGCQVHAFLTRKTFEVVYQYGVVRQADD